MLVPFAVDPPASATLIVRDSPGVTLMLLLKASAPPPPPPAPIQDPADRPLPPAPMHRPQIEVTPAGTVKVPLLVHACWPAGAPP